MRRVWVRPNGENQVDSGMAEKYHKLLVKTCLSRRVVPLYRLWGSITSHWMLSRGSGDTQESSQRFHDPEHQMAATCFQFADSQGSMVVLAGRPEVFPEMQHVLPQVRTSPRIHHTGLCALVRDGCICFGTVSTNGRCYMHLSQTGE
jgi:hypothetical protein